MGSRGLWIKLSVVVLLSTPSIECQVTLWGVDDSESPPELITFASDAPELVTVVGPVNLPDPNYYFSGLDFDASGALWGYVSDSDGDSTTPVGLYQLDPGSGAATFIGEGGLPSQTSILDLAYSPLDDQLYGLVADQGSAYAPTYSALYTIDRLTGEATEAIVLDDTVRASGLAVDGCGDFYLQPLDGDRMIRLCGTTLAPCRERLFYMRFSQGITIDWDGDGTWYHAAWENDDLPGPPNKLVVIGPDGSGEIVGHIRGIGPGANLGDVAIQPSQGGLSCFPIDDCNANGSSDACELASGVAADCDADFTPDECEASFDDCDGDGIEDSCQLYSRTAFDTAAINHPSVVAADFDEDGLADLLLTDVGTGDVHLLRGGTPPGTIGPETVPIGGDSRTSVTADFDNDGHLDFAVGSLEFGALHVGLGGGDGTFSVSYYPASAGTPLSALTAVDFNGDGFVDLVGGGSSSLTTHRLIPFQGDGMGGFTLLADILVDDEIDDLAASDLNSDGHSDLVVLERVRLRVYEGDGVGGFDLVSSQAFGSSGHDFVISDLNFDGNLDVVLTRGSSTSFGAIVVFHGTTGSAFSAPITIPTGLVARPLALWDANADGRDDLALAENFTFSGRLALLTHDGSGSFENLRSIEAGFPIQSLVSADFDGDGVDELMIAGKNGRVQMIESTADCDLNGIPDPCDLASGADVDGNGVVDSCERPNFRRGDCNEDGSFDVGDAITGLELLFGSPAVRNCADACDTNDDSAVDIADPISTLTALFGGGPEPTAPYPDCGVDPSLDGLDCFAFSACP